MKTKQSTTEVISAENETSHSGYARLVAGLTMEQWIEKETAKRKTTFWGAECEIQPVLHPKVFGNGRQLCYLGTIDQRPNYWLIRVSSTLDLDSDDFDMEEKLLMPLEEEFGRHPGFIIDEEEFNEEKSNPKSNYDLEDYDTFQEYESACEYPAIWWQGGHWGTIVNFGDKKRAASQPCH